MTARGGGGTGMGETVRPAQIGTPATDASTGSTIQLESVTKMFGHIRALWNVDLSVGPGEILALVGDNGAGKSTLLKVMSGLYQPDKGTVRLSGIPVSLRSPADARRGGIATVYQDLGLVDCLDISTNMFMGDLPRRGMFVDKRRMDRESKEFLESLKVPVKSVTRQVGMLSGGQRQLISIARALRLGAKAILLDEPTAALGVRETAQVVSMISGLRDLQCAVVVVTHDMDVVFQLCDRVQVMRLGQVAGVRDTRATTKEEVVGLITGAVSDHPLPEMKDK